MDISAEKEDIIRKFNQVHDIGLIKAIKSLLDFGLDRQDDDVALNASIQKGLEQLDNGMGIPHDEVMSDVRKRYNL